MVDDKIESMNALIGYLIENYNSDLLREEHYQASALRIIRELERELGLEKADNSRNRVLVHTYRDSCIPQLRAERDKLTEDIQIGINIMQDGDNMKPEELIADMVDYFNRALAGEDMNLPDTQAQKGGDETPALPWPKDWEDVEGFTVRPQAYEEPYRFGVFGVYGQTQRVIASRLDGETAAFLCALLSSTHKRGGERDGPE